MWGTGSRGQRGQAGAAAAGEDTLGLGGLPLSPHALLISSTPAGEGFAGRYGGRGSGGPLLPAPS